MLRRSAPRADAVAGTDRAVSLQEVARVAFQPGRRPADLEGGLYETGTFKPDSDTFPNGCHICEADRPRDRRRRDQGQIHGGVAQGLGQALMEQVAYDRQSGQLLTGSLMDYALPRADDLCPMRY